tara:strand:- start:552 stop:1211 length:660 start_codon:yes stop_codon:yes gene_type:complete
MKIYLIKPVMPIVLAIFLGCACNASRIVSPLELDEWRFGAAIGGPQVNSQRLPLMSIYSAKGITEEKSFYSGLQIVNLGFQSLQLDAGLLTRLKKHEGFSPEVNLKTGLNGMISFRDAATRIYPEIGILTTWKLNRFMPYLGSDLWIDPTYGLTEFSKGSLLHPSLQSGVRYLSKYFEFGIEAKWLNPTRTFIIPQQDVPSFMGLGARGLYFTIAYRML